MKKFILMAVVLILFFYEASYRAVSGRYGELIVISDPPVVYYATPYFFANDFLYYIFWPRINLPLGMVRLSPGTGVYVKGGDFYKKNKDGDFVLLIKGRSKQ